jgi:hypothetical protein
MLTFSLSVLSVTVQARRYLNTKMISDIARRRMLRRSTAVPRR